MVFSNDIFRKIAVTFSIAKTDYFATDQRGNSLVSGIDVTISFKVGSPSPQLKKDYSGVEHDEILTGYCLDGELDRRIKPGDVGRGNYMGRDCSVEVRTLGQSGIIPVTSVLGEKYTLLLRYKIKSNVAI